MEVEIIKTIMWKEGIIRRGVGKGKVKGKERGNMEKWDERKWKPGKMEKILTK